MDKTNLYLDAVFYRIRENVNLHQKSVVYSLFVIKTSSDEWNLFHPVSLHSRL